MEYMDETTLAHKRTSPWLIAFRIIFTIALIWCILFIFHNSLETSSISSARSHEVMQKINAILAHLNIGPLSEHVVRKLAHFSEFTLEGFLLMLCLRVYTRRFVRHVSWPMLGGMATALLDETIQLYVPGRTSSVRDVWIDFGGVIAGLFVALLLLLIVRRLTSFHAM
ncbi:MAG TPA: VanZ family protein, partial [Gemmiger qucibialis]|nr:VanZ family protein [Gemmiger qucibialis]